MTVKNQGSNKLLNIYTIFNCSQITVMKMKDALIIKESTLGGKFDISHLPSIDYFPIVCYSLHIILHIGLTSLTYPVEGTRAELKQAGFMTDASIVLSRTKHVICQIGRE